MVIRTDFSCHEFGLSAKQVTGVIFAIIHYNRPNSFFKALDSVLTEVRDGDCVILIDNGSDSQIQAEVSDYFRQTTFPLLHRIRAIYATTPINEFGYAAYKWLVTYLLSDFLPKASHFLLFADDDMLVPGWRREVEEYLGHNSWVTWGFDYYHWSDERFEKACPHSGRVDVIEGMEAHLQWLNAISGQPSDTHKRQAHSSSVAMSLQSLRQASQEFPTVIPLPYCDVGFALILAFSDKLIYIDRPLGLIGRNTNYGVGNSIVMAKNHVTRRRIRGFPTLAKYLASTYCECLLMLDREDLIRPATRSLLIAHLKATCKAMGVILQQDMYTWPMLAVRAIEEMILLISIISYSLSPTLSERLVLWLLGITPSFSIGDMKSIKSDFIDFIQVGDSSPGIFI